MIDLLLTCEAMDPHPHGCEDSLTIELENGVALTEHGIRVEVTVPLEDGWAVEYERGCPRLRCPEHAPDPPALEDGDVEFSERGDYVWACHTPTGLRASQYIGHVTVNERRARRLARKKLAYAVARRAEAGES